MGHPAELRSGTTSFYEADGLGSITSISNAAASLAQTYTFNAFGNLAASSGSLTNPLQYTGRDFDSETGLYYYRARYYDPAGGRFLSEDPLEFGSSNNFYPFTENDPINLRDPLGLQAAPQITPNPGPYLVPKPGPTATPAAGAIGEVLSVIGVVFALEGSTANEAQDTIHAPAPLKCKNHDCDKLLQEIYRYMSEISHRIGDLLNDPLNLYDLAYSQPNPAMPNAGSYVGHLQQVEGWQRGLRNLLQEALKMGCPIPPGAWPLATTGLPSMPRGR